MTFRRSLETLRLSVAALLVCSALPAPSHAQTLLASAPPEAPTSFIETAPPVSIPPLSMGSEHKFWDKKNCALFVAAAALNGADFAVTRANLQSGGRELNPVVRMFGRSALGPGGELRRRNCGSSQSQLLLSQNRPSQTGTSRFDAQHRQLGRRGELRTDASLKVPLQQTLVPKKKGHG